jgi:hypothetical protein
MIRPMNDDLAPRRKRGAQRKRRVLPNHADPSAHLWPSKQGLAAVLILIFASFVVHTGDTSNAAAAKRNGSSPIIHAPALTAQFDPIEVSGDRTQFTTANSMSAESSIYEVVGSSGVLNQGPGGFVWGSNGSISYPCAGNIPSSYYCNMTGVGPNGSLAGYLVDDNGNDAGIIDWEGLLGPYHPACPSGAVYGTMCSTGPMAPDVDIFAVRAISQGGEVSLGYLARTVQGSPTYVGPYILTGAKSSAITGIGPGSPVSYVVGNVQYANNSNTAFLADSGLNYICNLDPTGLLGSQAQGVTQTGGAAMVVGSSNGSNGFSGPAIWGQSPLSPCNLTLSFTGGLTGQASAGGNGAAANAVSQDGEVIVGSANLPNPSPGRHNSTVAFRWTCNNGMESIEQLLVDSGVGYRDLKELDSAVAISEDGTAIAGNGIDTMGNQVARAWYAVLPLPGPPTLTVAPASNSANLNFHWRNVGIGANSGGAAYLLTRSTSNATSYVGNLYAIAITTNTGVPPWLSVDQPLGSLTNATPTSAVNFSVNASVANGLPNGFYQATITITFGNLFANTTTIPLGCTIARLPSRSMS